MDEELSIYNSMMYIHRKMCTRMFNKGKGYTSLLGSDLNIKSVKSIAILDFYNFICDPKNNEIVKNNVYTYSLIKFFSKYILEKKLSMFFKFYIKDKNLKTLP